MRRCILRFFLPGRVLLPIAFALMVPKAHAIPAFSRQYQTSCSTCHIDFPKLNDFGKAFKDAGFKFPKDDETYLKVPATLLGAPAQKDVWPNAIWPGTIPGLPPIGFRMNTFFSGDHWTSQQLQQRGSTEYGSSIHSGHRLRDRIIQHILGW